VFTWGVVFEKNMLEIFWKTVYSLGSIKCCNVWSSYSGVADKWGLLGYDDVSIG